MNNRDEQIVNMYHYNEPRLTLDEIGKIFHLTRERIRQIINDYSFVRNPIRKIYLTKEQKIEKRILDAKNRFWSNVKKASNGCWEWIGCKFNSGYGSFGCNLIAPKEGYAHRMSWILTNGVIPPSSCVLHHCDNKSCVNPSHLYLGTQKENMKDRETRGRGNHSKGIKRKNFSDYTIDTIVEKYNNGRSIYSLSKEYSCNPSTIRHHLKVRLTRI